MNQELERRFHYAMIVLYRRAKDECGYNSIRFLNMINEYGGLETARILLNSTVVSDGYTAMWERQRLDLIVEAIILKPEWKELFSDDERKIAKTRLEQYGYKFTRYGYTHSDSYNIKKKRNYSGTF